MMTVAVVIVFVVLAVVFIASGLGKLLGLKPQAEAMAKVNVPPGQVKILGAIELIGAVGLIAGLFWRPLGIAAGVGAILYFGGAVYAHIRAKDPQWQPAGALALLGVAAVVLGALTV